MVMSALSLVASNADPTEREVREWLEGNLCRCTGYETIMTALHSVIDGKVELIEVAPEPQELVPEPEGEI
jgi:carbon-monoxide dehydrogenase small subunit